MSHCVDCLNHRLCKDYDNDVTRKACGAFVQEVKDPNDKKGYDDFLDNEQHTREVGGIDPKTRFRFEYWDIGMVRNASEGNKKKMKVFLDPSPHVVLTQNVPLRGWYKAKVEPKGKRNRPCFTEALLTQPYGGSCPVRCAFCYVNNGIRGYRGQGVTVVDPAYPDKVQAQLEKMKFAWNAYISSFTEPFQQIEKHYHNTERLSEIVTRYGLPLFYLTRQVPPDWANRFILKNKHSYQQYSIITNDRIDYKRLSPGAASFDDLMASIREQRKMGIYISIQCNPIIAGVTSNQQIVSLIHELAKNGTNHIIFKFVEIVAPAVPAMIRKIGKLFPDRINAFKALFTENIGGLRTIKESYRIQALELFKQEVTRVGMTMGLCYEYAYERDDTGKVLSKDGISLGRRFCTADQCHGQRSPLYVKAGSTFKAFSKCPPSGCLYCSEATNGVPPCGVKHLQKAIALGPADYNKPYWKV